MNEVGLSGNEQKKSVALSLYSVFCIGMKIKLNIYIRSNDSDEDDDIEHTLGPQVHKVND